MLTEFVTGISQKAISELKQADKEEREKLIETFTNLIDLSIMLLRESPELRQAFGKIHSEFLKFPESKSTIEQALAAYKNFTPNSFNSELRH